MRRHRRLPLLLPPFNVARGMTADERSPLPESAGSLFDAAARAYGRRLWLYLGLALFALAIQAT